MLIIAYASLKGAIKWQRKIEIKAKVTSSSNPEVTALEVAKELGISLNEGYNGELTSFEAGKVGGKIGGSMVKELIKMAQESLKKEQ